MRTITDYFSGEGHGVSGTSIKSLKDMRDIYKLSIKSIEELPLLIGHPFSKGVFDIYKKCLSNELKIDKIEFKWDKSYYVYECEPIDDWRFWTKIYIEDLLQNSELMSLVLDGMGLFKSVGWEEDIREGPFITIIPNGTECGSLILALKQDNNGTTYICSKENLRMDSFRKIIRGHCEDIYS